MTTYSVSAILHGQCWPDAAWSRDLRAALSAPAATAPARFVEVIEAHERPTTAIGAAAAILEAVERVKGELLLVVEAGAHWTEQLLAELCDTVCDADVLAVAPPDRAVHDGVRDFRAHAWNDAWPPGALSQRAAIFDVLISSSQVGLDAWAERLHAGRPRLWAIRRATLARAGGLDPDSWGVALVEDLAGRCAARGIGTRVVRGANAAAHDAWPLAAHVRQFLTVRNTLLSATTTLAPGAAGRVFGAVGALALGDAWQRAAIPTESLHFGGAWGSPRGLKALARSPRPARDLWPADETGCILPVLALDAFLEVLLERADRTGSARHLRTPTFPAAEAGTPGDRETGNRVLDDAATWQPARPDLGAPVAPTGSVRDLPLASVIVVNWNGRAHLDSCFASLQASDYPAERLELICVDNGSTDGSVEFVSARFPRVRVVPLPANRGFTGGNQAGVTAARGEVLLFFNNDIRVEPGTVRALVRALDDEHPCAAAVVRDWRGKHIDFVRGSVNFEGRGFQEHFGERWRPGHASADTFFPNGAAFAITRRAYEDAGGFDAAYFAYYEDVDLGFGLRMGGRRVRVAPQAMVYHRHGATSAKYPSGQKRFLMERNAFWTALKRYEDTTLDRAAGTILLLQARRIAQETLLRRGHPWVEALSTFSSRCRKRPRSQPNTSVRLLYEAPAHLANATAQGAPNGRPADRTDEGVLIGLPLESLAATGEALRGLPDLSPKRRRAQDRRRLSDGAVFRESGRALAYSSPLVSYQAAQDALVDLLELDRVFRGRTRLLLLTHEPLRLHMSGPAVRVLELGRALSRTARVTVAAPAVSDIDEARCTLAAYSPDRPATLRRLAEQADTIVVQGFALTQFPFLTGMHVPIVVDLYCPFTLEFLEMKTGQARAEGAAVPDVDLQVEAIRVLEVQNAQLRHGDFFLCANERQRDFWIGTLHTAGRVNALTYAVDPTLWNLVGIVPFGVSDEEFGAAARSAAQRAGGPVLKGARAGINRDDRVLYWGGSLLDWQDPLTLVRATALVAESRDDVKLFFAGVRHPNPHVAPMRLVEETRNLARDLGILDRHVFLNEWVPYELRAAYLHEADLGVSTHRLHLETHFSFRTRFLDYIWATLPIVCTEGDHFAALVHDRGLGLVVAPGDERALAAAIVRLLDDETLREGCRRALAEVREELRWTRVAEPLRRFVSAPQFAADHEPALRQIRARLRRGYRLSRWAKRTALRAGISEARVEQWKSTRPVQIAMHLRNRLALARAGKIRN